MLLRNKTAPVARATAAFACAVAAGFAPAAWGEHHEAGEEAIKDALAHEARPAEDVEADAGRLPLETLTFAGLQPGMAVFEMEAGSGYYTEIISRAVGEEGSVVLQNPAGFDNFLGDAVDVRLADDRLANVRWSKSNFDALDAEDGSIDMVTWIQGPHELWFSPAEGVSFGDPETAFAEIARVLKPGGVFLAVDHIAPDGSGPETGGTLHRIRQDIVNEYAEGAGLALDRTSDALNRPDDPLDVGVFDESIRGQTSQFIALYTKPAE